jgi:bacteriocin-like protein
MEDSTKPKETAKQLGIDPEKIDFSLSEKELENISGGTNCGEIGLGNPNCTKTGISSGCTEIGLLNPDCTKAGVS